jgi:NTP pyrophosphatase (non-canonical NTP hydrolase)
MVEKIFTKLREANLSRNKEWDPDNKLGPLFFSTELAGECGEACNVVKKLEREKLGLRGSRSDKMKLAEELADVIICADLLAIAYDINIEKAVTTKFNKTSLEQNLSIFLPFSEETEL